jgi:hypothetical protein
LVLKVWKTSPFLILIVDSGGRNLLPIGSRQQSWGMLSVLVLGTGLNPVGA